MNGLAQGESDAGYSSGGPTWAAYRPLLQLLITTWRAALQPKGTDTPLPFVVVQLPGMEARYDEGAFRSCLLLPVCSASNQRNPHYVGPVDSYGPLSRSIQPYHLHPFNRL